MPPILQLRDIHLTFGSTPLLEGAELSILPGECICVVGRNGSGKSTLLQIAAGTIEPDKGDVFLQPGVTARYLQQEPDISGYSNIGDYVAAGLGPADDPRQVEYLLRELGLTGQEDPTRLSGGELRRAALAQTLAPQPDILFLDEPTNHLDLPAIEWLENHLAGLRSAIVLISHDRAFLRRLSRRTVWVDRGKTRVLNAGFEKFESWRDDILEQEVVDQHKLGRTIVREDHWVTHGVSGRRKRNIRRLKELQGMRKSRSEHRKVEGDVAFTINEGESSGKLVVVARNISKSYNDHPVVSGFSIRIARGDRIGIVGQNGAGKTTLLNMLCGNLKPDSGGVKPGANVLPLIIDQKRESLDPNWTLQEAMTDGSGDLVSIGPITKHVIAYMKDFLFLPEQARTPLHALSGGERARLQLARGLRHPSNFLILDEPTNDLDLETLDLLQEMIADYAGTVLVVSHDRDFLDRVSTSMLAPADHGKWIEYQGGYSDMMALKKTASKGEGKSASEKSAKTRGSSQDQLRDTPASGEKKRLSFKHKHALETLPMEIDKLSDIIAKCSNELAAPDLFGKNPRRFDKLMRTLSAAEKKLAETETKWLELEMMREEIEG